MNKADPARIVTAIAFLCLGLLALSMSGVDQPPMPPRVSEVAVEANDWCDKCDHHVCHATVEGHTSGTVCGLKRPSLDSGGTRNRWYSCDAANERISNARTAKTFPTKRRQTKPTMKKLLFLIPVIAMLVGCANTGPLATQTGIFLGVSAALRNNPKLVPAAKVGAAITCAVAEGTNANPATLVSEIEAAGPWTYEEWLLLNGVVIVGVEIGANASTGSAEPYLKAACLGLKMAVAGAPADAPQERAAPTPASRAKTRAASARAATQPPSDPKWPQMRYP